MPDSPSPRADITIKLALLAVAAVLMLALVQLFANARYLTEEKLGALGWSLFPEYRLEQRITVIAIDEASLKQVGPWPWPRTVMAELSQALADAGVALQVYDMVFPEAKPNDASLVARFREHRAVIGQTPLLEGDQPIRTGQMAGAWTTLPCQPPIMAVDNFVANHARFNALSVGHLAPTLDDDGMIRKQPALLCVDGRVYPSLALQALFRGFNPAGQAVLNFQLQPGQHWLDPAWVLQLANFPNIRVPLDQEGHIRFAYHLAPEAFQVVSAADVLNHRVPSSILQNTWAVVGATAFGLGDIVPTPHSGETPGVVLQVRMLAALLDGEVPYTPKGAWVITLLECTVFAVLLLLASIKRYRLSAVALPVLVCLLPLLAWYVHISLVSVNLWVGWLSPALFAVLAGALLSFYEQWCVRLERQRIFTNLSRYLPSQVANTVAYAIPSGAVEAERKHLVLLSADLRNFSAYEEARPPEETAALLHCFFVTASAVVEDHGGVVEEFSGDAVLASWTDSSRAACQAYAAAQQLYQQVTAILPTQTPTGLEPLAVGVGIEKGPVLVGSLGPAHRRTHTLLGDTVAITLRIQAMTQDLAQPILVGECAARDIPTDQLESQGVFLLDDLKTPHTLFATQHVALCEPFDESESAVTLRVIQGNRR